MIAFVRHGQTELNHSGCLQGRLDAPLSDLGTRQAAALGDALAGAPVTAVLSSPLQRALATATAIAAAHELEAVVDERLIELDYGSWDGVKLADVPADAWARGRADPEFAPPGGEPLTAVTTRVASFCAERLEPDDAGLVLAVSHVSPIKAAVCLALGVDERVSWQMQLAVASVTRVGRRADGRPYLGSFNETPYVTPR